MTVRNGVLALLVDRPMFGAQLKAEFEARTGSTWPLNVGQIYTTLDRLERDGLVEVAGAPDESGRIVYRLTDLGQADAERWWAEPVNRDQAPRSELAIKLALAVTVPGVDVGAVVQAQRRASVRALQDLTRLKRGAAGGAAELAWQLVLDHLIFTAEAEVRWLDHVEGGLPSAGVRPRPALSDEIGETAPLGSEPRR